MKRGHSQAHNTVNGIIIALCMLTIESEGDDVEDMEEEEPSPAATVPKQNSPTTKVLFAQYCPIRVCTEYKGRESI